MKIICILKKLIRNEGNNVNINEENTILKNNLKEANMMLVSKYFSFILI